ncbi:MAG: hypothetical protein ACYDAY_10440 [Candidatus Dormibacteria bacterium]
MAARTDGVMARARFAFGAAAVLAVTIVAAPAASANGFFSSAGGGPAARFASTMAYDPSNSSAVLFGGCTEYTATTSASQSLTVYSSLNPLGFTAGQDLLCPANANLGDTWVFSSGSWSRANPASSPHPRFAASSAYDQANGKVLLFGGIFESENPTDATAPAGATSCAADYVNGLRYPYTSIVDGNANLYLWCFADTWEWDGSNWTRLSDGSGTGQPAARFDAAMAVNSDTRPVLMGGCADNGAQHQAGGAWDCSAGLGRVDSDMWTWTGTAWSEMAASLPSARRGLENGASYDPGSNQMFLYGGYGGWSGSAIAEAWEFDPSLSQWINVCGIGGGTGDCTSTNRPGKQSFHSTSYYFDGQAWEDLVFNGDNAWSYTSVGGGLEGPNSWAPTCTACTGNAGITAAAMTSGCGIGGLLLFGGLQVAQPSGPFAPGSVVDTSLATTYRHAYTCPSGSGGRQVEV